MSTDPTMDVTPTATDATTRSVAEAARQQVDESLRGVAGETGGWLDGLRDLFNYEILRLGETPLTLWTILYVAILLVVLTVVSRKLTDWMERGLLRRGQMDTGSRDAIRKTTRYLILVIGTMVILESAGVDLGSLTVIFGALGIGIGFGLQNIINNFVSGLIILFERPIKVGDRVQVGEVFGNVENIAIRATTVITNDNISIIVPNSEFISKQVINWSHNDPNVRISVPVGVAYGTDPDLVRDALLEVAESHDGVLEHPAPDVLFEEFGDSSLNFTLRVWSNRYTTRPGVFKSELNFLIARKLAEAGIQVPFPQRDLHIRSGTLPVRNVTAEDGADEHPAPDSDETDEDTET